METNKIRAMRTSDGNSCESCGMPMRRLSDFGSYKDGSVNTEYCRYCYQHGEFTGSELTLGEKIA